MPVELLTDRINNFIWEVISQGNNDSLSPFLFRDGKVLKQFLFTINNIIVQIGREELGNNPNFPQKGVS